MNFSFIAKHRGRGRRLLRLGTSSRFILLLGRVDLDLHAVFHLYGCRTSESPVPLCRAGFVYTEAIFAKGINYVPWQLRDFFGAIRLLMPHDTARQPDTLLKDDDVGTRPKAEGRAREADPQVGTLIIPWTKTHLKKRRELIAPLSTSARSDPRPIRAEARTKLIAAIAKGRTWLDELVAGTVSNAGQIAAREACTVRQVNMKISLAFLSPDLVNAAIEGRLPRGFGVANLRDAPLLWSEQSAMLGLAPRR